jgi:hypothetical protein
MRIIRGVAVALTLHSGAAAAPATLTVDISGVDGLTPQALRGMMREANAIWGRHGVSLAWVTHAGPSVMPAGRVLAVVSMQGCPPSVANARADLAERRPVRLGAAVFAAGSLEAENTIVLSVDAISYLIDGTFWVDRPVREWPDEVREELVGRASGRVLAHEIGHYLLAWRSHTEAGLMQTAFQSAMLLDPTRTSFELPGYLLPRLRARLERLAASKATLARVR